jgi:hypothetical protein
LAPIAGKVHIPVPAHPTITALLHPAKNESESGTASSTFPATGACVTPNWQAITDGLQLSRIIPPGGADARQFTVPFPVPGLSTSIVKALEKEYCINKKDTKIEQQSMNFFIILPPFIIPPAFFYNKMEISKNAAFVNLKLAL